MCLDLLTGAAKRYGAASTLLSRRVGRRPSPVWYRARDLNVIEASAPAGARPRRAEGRCRARADCAGSGNVRLRDAAAQLPRLVERRVPKLAADLQALVGDRALRGLALRSLAAYDDPATPEVILKHYGEYSASRA